MSNVIEVENLSKQYKLGVLGINSIKDEFGLLMKKLTGRKSEILTLGEDNDRSTVGTSNYVWSIRDLSFNVKEGEVLGIVGKNGAGKSTLLKMLSRVTAPTTGSIRMNGRVASLLEVGTGFHKELTGRENIYLNGAILGMTKRDINVKFDEIVEFSGVSRYIDTPVKRYSSGMYVRLAFAVAAHLEPEILIVDEVLAVGDQEFQDKCIGKMKDVSGQGRTVLFVSHNLAAVKSLCSRGLLLKNGRKVFEGSTLDTLEKYMEKEDQIAADGKISREIKEDLKAIITHISIVDDKEQINQEVFYQDEIIVNLTIDSMIDDKVLLDLNFNTKEGVSVVYAVNSFDKQELQLTKGINHFKVKLRNDFLPGKYYVNVGVHDIKGMTIDYLENVTNITVLNVAKVSENSYPFNWVNAYTKTNGIWLKTN